MVLEPDARVLVKCQGPPLICLFGYKRILTLQWSLVEMGEAQTGLLDNDFEF